MSDANNIQQLANILFKFQEDFKSVKLNKSGTVNGNSEYAIKCRYWAALEEIGFSIRELHKLADKMRPQLEKR